MVGNEFWQISLGINEAEDGRNSDGSAYANQGRCNYLLGKLFRVHTDLILAENKIVGVEAGREAEPFGGVPQYKSNLYCYQ
uniref:Uncharacterized protein n=1 Tax=Romanomermis culicivorax TaxID=13658 RepID=A0A915KAP2_ROMCU